MKIDDYIDLFNIDSKCFAKTYDIIEYMLNDFKKEKESIHKYYKKEIEEQCDIILEYEKDLHQANILNAKLNNKIKSLNNRNCTSG